MRFEGKRDRAIEIHVGGREIVLIVDFSASQASIEIDTNTAEALETALRAARLELQAREVRS